VSSRESWSGLHLRDPERDPGGAAGTPPASGASAEADRIVRSLVAFVNAHIMARGREIRANDELESVGVDSMGLLKILLFIEAEFGFWMPDADLVAENIASLQALANYVSCRRSLV
jgi:acyl carrier protein